MAIESNYQYKRYRWYSHYTTDRKIVMGNQFGFARFDKPDERNTVSNPDYKQVIAKGGDATNPYYRRRCSHTPERLSGQSWSAAYAVDPAWPYTVIGSDLSVGRALGPFHSVFSGDDIPTRDLALARLKRKLSSHTKEFQALVPLAEVRDLRTTIVGAANITMALVKDLVSFKKRMSFKDAQQHAADAWLTWSFGIAPTLGDIENLQQSIATYLNANDYSVVLTGAASKEWKSRVAYENIGALVNANAFFYNDCHHTLSYKYTAGFNLDIRSANNYGLSDHLGFDWQQLPSVLWELTAFSWIFDYFSTVGAFLEDTFSSSPTTTRYVCLNRRYVLEGTTNGLYKETPGVNCKVIQQTNIPGPFKYFSFSREKLTTLPTRSLRLKTVDEIGANAVNRLLNLTSLLVKMK